MTLTSQIITDAFRQSNLIALTTAPTTAQVTEALRYLNRIVKSVFGNEVGEQLENVPLGRQNIQRPTGYPWYNDNPGNNWFVMKDSRLLLNLTRSINIYLSPAPNDGTRVAVVNVSSDLVNNPVTIFGNGRLINGAQSLVANTNTFNQEFMYRDDIASWNKYAPLIVDPTIPTDDPFPFPEEFDDYFISMLAMRLNPSYGAQMDQQSQMVLQRMTRNIKSRYSQHIFVPTETALWRLADVAADRTQWGYWGNYDSTSEFNSGRPWQGFSA